MRKSGEADGATAVDSFGNLLAWVWKKSMERRQERPDY